MLTQVLTTDHLLWVQVIEFQNLESQRRILMLYCCCLWECAGASDRGKEMYSGCLHLRWLTNQQQFRYQS